MQHFRLHSIKKKASYTHFFGTEFANVFAISEIKKTVYQI